MSNFNTVAKEIVRAFEAQGIEHVFGMPGYQTTEIYDALLESKIKSVLVTSETFAPYMAEGYSYASGRIAVCLSIPGPGFAYMFSGIAEALVDSFPLLVLVVGSNKKDKSFSIHEIDQYQAVCPLVKRAFKLKDPQEIIKVINEALFIALSEEQGPVIIEIPEKFISQAIEVREIQQIQATSGTIDKKEIEGIVKIIKESKRCGLYIGKGALAAKKEIVALAEIINAPIATTISGRGIISEDYKLSVGYGFGPTGTKIAEKVFNECDCVIAIGCKFSEVSTGQWGIKIPSKLIHIDINPEVFNKNYSADFSFCADARRALSEILKYKEEFLKKKDDDFIKEILQGKEQYESFLREKDQEDSVSPSRFYYELRKQMKSDAILTVDCGYHQLWSYTDFKVLAPRAFLTTSNFQAMGFSIPAAIGAKLASPERDIVCLCGDGCFLMSGFELLTAKREHVKIICIIFNDNNLGLIKHIQDKVQARNIAVDLNKFNFESYAEAIAFDYLRIKNDRDIAKVLSAASSAENSVIVDVNINYTEEPIYYKGLSKTIWQNFSDEEKLRRTAKILKRKKNEL